VCADFKDLIYYFVLAQNNNQKATLTAVAEAEFSPTFMQLGSLNLTHKCATMSPGNIHFVVKRDQVTSQPAWVYALF